VTANTTTTPPRDPGDFSLVNGGALFELWRRTRLAGEGLEFIHRRILVMVIIAWVPLLLLSIAEGRAWGEAVTMTFLQDLETHARLLVGLPLLLLAEGLVHRALPPVVRHFVECGLVTAERRPRFDAAVASALRWRSSVAVEVAMAVVVYALVVPFIWRDQVAINVDSWYATLAGGRLQPSLAGWWMGLVGMPLFILLVLRWAFRQLVWTRFLWQVARLDLALEPTHPDGAAGLHFISLTERAYRPILLAMGAVLSGMIANRIFHTGAQLADFKVEIAGAVAILMVVILGPMLVFVPNLVEARRRGLVAYGTLGQRYAREFGAKWMRARDPGEPLLGSPDIQSLADLRNGYQVIAGIRLVPFGLWNVAALAVSVVLPLAPLLLTKFSLNEILDRVFKSFF
jgi:hypothetical protein